MKHSPDTGPSCWQPPCRSPTHAHPEPSMGLRHVLSGPSWQSSNERSAAALACSPGTPAPSVFRCATFKVLLASAVLRQSTRNPGLLQQEIRYQRRDLVSYSPITEQQIDAGMTVAGLCAAALRYSDNTAATLLLTLLGGPQAVTAYARSISDREFRLDRWEIARNTAIPGDPRDTSTPRAMARSLRRLVLEDTLEAGQRAPLKAWLIGNTTGGARIRAGVPAAWQIADKTGDAYGTANDIAVLWPPARAPIVVTVYTTQADPQAAARNELLVAAARTVVDCVSQAPRLDRAAPRGTVLSALS